MSIVPPSYYTFNPDPAVKTITFSAPYDSITAEEIVSIRNLSKQIEIYNSSDPRNHSASIPDTLRTQDFDIAVTNGVLTYVESAGMVNTDKLQIVIGWSIIDGGTP